MSKMREFEPNGEVPEEIRTLVEAQKERERKIRAFEAEEPFIQDLRELATITKASGIKRQPKIYTLEDANKHFNCVSYLDRIMLTENTIAEGKSVNIPRVRVIYFGDSETSLTIHMPSFRGWEELEEPGESRINPKGEKWKSTGDWVNCMWIRGPSDSLGPKTLELLRNLTSQALTALRDVKPQKTDSLAI